MSVETPGAALDPEGEAGDGAASGTACAACGCSEEGHGDEDGDGITCPHECTGWFYVEVNCE